MKYYATRAVFKNGSFTPRHVKLLMAEPTALFQGVLVGPAARVKHFETPGIRIY
jgi:hypothetical protein